jgi:endogenous inhibitor of DNA gyrase (YacG/DUF329 family)
MIYHIDYYGFIYLWYDKSNHKFYIGSHHGSIDDGYLCSSKWVKAAIRKRPQDFKRRIIKYNPVDDVKETQRLEQYYLDMIKDEELSFSKSVMENTNRYYNMKKKAVGGNGAANKGKSHQAWNYGLTKETYRLRKEGLFCLLTDKPKPNPNKSVNLSKAMKGKSPRNKGIKTGLVPWNKGKGAEKIKTKNRKLIEKPIDETICPECGTIFDRNRSRSKIYCSRRCASISNGRKANSAENGRKGALAQSQTVIGRRRSYRDDGSWFWEYPEKK